jgi:hypothetical protein
MNEENHNLNNEVPVSVLEKYQECLDRDSDGKIRAILEKIQQLLNMDLHLDTNAPLILYSLATYNQITPHGNVGAIQMITNPEALCVSLSEQKKFVDEFKQYVRDVLEISQKKDVHYNGTKS